MGGEALLQSLLERIERQLGFEYHDPEQAAWELENMTVKRLLEMLAYMMEPEPEMTKETHPYHIGPLTFDRVFRAGQLDNMADMQAVLDAVERALEAE